MSNIPKTQIATTDQVMQTQTVTLYDLLDRTINKGVVVDGQVMLTVADVDLVMLRLRLLLSGVETLNSGDGKGNGEMDSANLPQGKKVYQPAKLTAEVVGPELNNQLQEIFGEKARIDPKNVERGLAKLVLTLVELLRKLMESQALRRMEGGSLTVEETERLGLTFKRLGQRMGDLKTVFGLSDEDLNLDLGPLGKLM